MEFTVNHNKILINQTNFGIEVRLVSDIAILYKGDLVNDCLGEKGMDADDLEHYLTRLIKKKKLRVSEGEDSVALSADKMAGIPNWTLTLERSIVADDAILLSKVESLESKAITGWVLIAPSEHLEYDGWEYTIMTDGSIKEKFSQLFFESVRARTVRYYLDPTQIHNAKIIEKSTSFDELKNTVRKCSPQYKNAVTQYTEKPLGCVVRIDEQIHMCDDNITRSLFKLTFPNLVLEAHENDAMIKTCAEHRVDMIRYKVCCTNNVVFHNSSACKPCEEKIYIFYK